MRKMLLTATVAAFTLGGCATTGTGTGPTVDQIIAIAKETARIGCSFLADDSFIREVLDSANPALGTGAAIGNAICHAVLSPAAVRGERVPTVSGIPVRGVFVR